MATAKVWTAVVASGKINVRSKGSCDRLAGKEYVRIGFRATAPDLLGCTDVTSVWSTAVKQSNAFNGAGNDFALSGAAPSVLVKLGVGPLATIQVSAIGDQVAGTPFTVQATGDRCVR